jgi:hypothetical protein
MRFYWATVFGGYAAWLAFWLVMGCFAAWRQGVSSDFFIEASRKQDAIGMQVGTGHSQYFGSWISDALMWGGLWPIPVMTSLVVFGLVFRRLAQMGK